MSQDSRPFQWHNGESLDDKNFRLDRQNLIVVVLLLAFVLVLVLVLCLFFRRMCFSPAAASAGDDHEGMEDAAVMKLPARVRRGEPELCSICLSMLMEGEKERVLPGCRHGFHPVCVDEWLRKRSSCPLCRANVVGEEKVAEV